MLTHLVSYLLVLSKIDDHSLQDVKSESHVARNLGPTFSTPMPGSQGSSFPHCPERLVP